MNTTTFRAQPQTLAQQVYNAIAELKGTKVDTMAGINHFLVDKPADKFCAAFDAFVPDFNFLPEYETILDWLNDNHSKGLFLRGDSGVGKTVIATKVIPTIFQLDGLYLYDPRPHDDDEDAPDWMETRFTAHIYAQGDINRCYSDITASPVAVLDDIGNENELVVFGNRRWVVAEFIDRYTHAYGVPIITTNLSDDMLRIKYGASTVDKITQLFTVVDIHHTSMRRY